MTRKGHGLFQLPRKLEKAEIEWDVEVAGLGIRANRNGTTNYIAKISMKGRAHWYTICAVSLIQLDQVRNLVMRMKMLAAKGTDPSALVQFELDKVSGIVRNKTVSFGEFSIAYIRDHAKVWKKSWLKDQQMISYYLLPIWSDKELANIKRADIDKLHKQIGKDRQCAANHVVELLHVMFNQARYLGYLPENFSNPAEGIKKFKKRSRHRRITSAELPLIVREIHKLERVSYRVAFLLDLIVGFRVSELLMLRWEHVDLDSAMIFIPDTKSGKPHWQPLPAAAVELLIQLPSKGVSPWVFQSHIHRDRPLVSIHKAWKKVCKSAGINDLRIHDIRRTTASCLVEQTGDLRLVGEVLNQTQQSVTARYAHHDKEHIRKALDEHANKILALGSSCN